jgi:hypothetical protein
MVRAVVRKCGSTRPVRATVSGGTCSTVVCDSELGSVRQCAWQCVAVRLAVCGCPAVWQCAAVRQRVAVRQCATTRHCVAVRARLCAGVRVAVCGSARGSVRQLFGSFR